MKCEYCDPEDYGTIDVGETNAPWTSIRIQNLRGEVKIQAYGSTIESYTPKFCPECGRRLIFDET